MEKIWRDPNEEQADCGSECFAGRPRIEDEFVKVIANRLTKILRLRWPEDHMFKSILISALEDDIKDLLGQFLNHEMERVGDRLNREFNIGQQICPNYITPSKLKRHIEAIKETWREKNAKERKKS